LKREALEEVCHEKRVFLLLCFFIWMMVFSFVSAGKCQTFGLNTNYVEAFQAEGDPTLYLFLFLMLSSDKEGVLNTQNVLAFAHRIKCKREGRTINERSYYNEIIRKQFLRSDFCFGAVIALHCFAEEIFEWMVALANSAKMKGARSSLMG
jgi:hypothetical protein